MLRLKIACLCLAASLATASLALAQSDDSGECDVATTPAAPFTFGLVEATQAATPCLFGAETLDLAGYQGHSEIALMAGSYANAMADYTRITAELLPDTPDVFDQIVAGYESQLAANPDSLLTLIDLGFAQWWVNDYEGAITTLDHLLELSPANTFGLLFRGSSRLFLGDSENGEVDVALAIERAPNSADVHFIAADAYAYALGDLARALEQASTAKDLGLDTPRVNAILATAYMDQGDEALATQYFASHIEGSTAEYVDTEPLARSESLTLEFVPGRSFRVPLELEAGETLVVTTRSEADGVDTLAVLLAPDRSLVTSNDDQTDLNAGIVRRLDEAGTYLLILGTFEGAGTGEVVLTRE